MIALAFTRPALPLHTAGPYVAAAYIVFVLLILIYVAIMALRLTRNQKDIENLTALMRERGIGDNGDEALEESLDGPALENKRVSS